MKKARYITSVNIHDPELNQETELEVYFDPESKGIFGIDATFADQVNLIVNSPYNDSEIQLPEAGNIMEGTSLEWWRIRQVEKIKKLMQRAEEITTEPGELSGHPDLEWLGQMPAYPHLYDKEKWEEHNRSVPYLIEEFNGTLEKLADEYPKLATIQQELKEIEAWEDI